jgi:hypothetical protein
MENLNKSNFFDEIEKKYPEAFTSFSEWIDRYKKEVNWNSLFNGGIGIHDGGYPSSDWVSKTEAPKFHDIPKEMQIGILLKFASENNATQNDLAKAFDIKNMSILFESVFAIIEIDKTKENGKRIKSKGGV